MKSWRSCASFCFPLLITHSLLYGLFFFFGLWTIVRFTASIERRKKGIGYWASAFFHLTSTGLLFASCLHVRKKEQPHGEIVSICSQASLQLWFSAMLRRAFKKSSRSCFFFFSRLQSKENRKVKGELTFCLFGHEGEFKQIPLLFLPTKIVHMHCFTSTVFASTLLSCVFVCVVCGTYVCCLSLSLPVLFFFFLFSRCFCTFFAVLLL